MSEKHLFVDVLLRFESRNQRFDALLLRIGNCRRLRLSGCVGSAGKIAGRRLDARLRKQTKNSLRTLLGQRLENLHRVCIPLLILQPARVRIELQRRAYFERVVPDRFRFIGLVHRFEEIGFVLRFSKRSSF